ncbi:MAG: isochorismatase family protein [Alphaproteobacteria bacterium]|nr:isochorismatase family protein [Alphaproteobacteria bacterium]
MLIERSRSCLLIVDVQERLMPSIAGMRAILGRILLLMKAARRLTVPMMATEHAPESIGPIATPVKAQLGGAEIFVKRHFDATAEPGFPEKLDKNRPQIIVCGTEAHVCVLQTALGLLSAGMAPIVVADAVGSREPADKDVALARLRDAGVIVASAEMVCFEWLGQAGTPEFRDLITLIK